MNFETQQDHTSSINNILDDQISAILLVLRFFLHLVHPIFFTHKNTNYETIHYKFGLKMIPKATLKLFFNFLQSLNEYNCEKSN